MPSLEGHTEHVNSVAVTEDGKVVSGSGDKTVKIWDIDTCRLIRSLEGATDEVNSVVVIQDRNVISGSSDKP
jgi:WD40 repeat protein